MTTPTPRTRDEMHFVNMMHIRRHCRMVDDPRHPGEWVAWQDYPGGWNQWFVDRYGRAWSGLVKAVKKSNPTLYRHHQELETNDENNQQAG